MLAVLNRSPTAPHSASTSLHLDNMPGKWAPYCVEPRAALTSSDSDTSSGAEVAITKDYRKAEKLFLGSRANSVAAALLDPTRQRKTSRFASFRSHNKTTPTAASSSHTKHSRSQRPVSSYEPRSPFEQINGNDELYAHIFRDEMMEWDDTNHHSIASAADSTTNESHTTGANRRPSARFAAFSKKWKRHLLHKMSATKRSVRLEQPAEARDPDADQSKWRKVDRKASIKSRWWVRSSSTHADESSPLRTEEAVTTCGTAAQEESLKTKLHEFLENGSRATLFNILRHKDLRDEFEKFLRKEYSYDNLDFWEGVESYRTQPDRVKVAEAIHSTFVAPNSPREVNLSYRVKMSILNEKHNPNEATFDEAQKEIFHLMETDSFPRFMASAR